MMMCVRNSLPHVFKSRALGSVNKYLDLIDNAESVIISRVGEDDLHQGIRDSVSATCRSCKGILKVGRGILDRGVTTEDDKTCNADAFMTLS